MTKDEVHARIAEAQSALEALETGDVTEPDPGISTNTRRRELETEIAGLKAMLDEV